MVEAANASQLRRNFEGSVLLLVPEVHWDLCSQRVMVMERMHGTPISQVQAIRKRSTSRRSPAPESRSSSQVFRDGFFHADMHPGNILSPPKATRAGATSRSISASWER